MVESANPVKKWLIHRGHLLPYNCEAENVNAYLQQGTEERDNHRRVLAERGI